MDKNNFEHKDIEYICPICKKELFLQETFEKVICPFCNNEISTSEKDKLNITNEGVLEKIKPASRLATVLKRIVWPLFLVALGLSLLCGSGIALCILVHGHEAWPPITIFLLATFALIGIMLILLQSFRYLHQAVRKHVLSIVLGCVLLTSLAYGVTYWKMRPKHERSTLVQSSFESEVARLVGLYPGDIVSARDITLDGPDISTASAGAIKVRKMLIATWKLKDMLERSPTKEAEKGDYEISTIVTDQKGVALIFRIDGWIAIASGPFRGPDLRRVGSCIKLKDKRSAPPFGVSEPGQYLVDVSGHLISAVRLFGWVMASDNANIIFMILFFFQLFPIIKLKRLLWLKIYSHKSLSENK